MTRPTGNPAPLLGGAAVEQAGVSQAGAKACRLAQLRRYGFPVPELYVIPAWVHTAWLQRSGLEPRLLQAVPAELAALHAQLLGEPLPETLVAALAPLVPSASSWAVRSSAPHEDGDTLSFAGQHATVLNVKNLSGLCAAVRQVWASLWTPAAVSYRAHHGVAAEVGMAVLLMPLVPAVSSGVAFTQDPVTGQAERLIIHANWGLGESLVQGHSAGDEITACTTPLNADLTDLKIQLNRKSQQVQVQPEGGTCLQTIPTEQQHRAVLNPAQARQLAGLVRQAALSLDFAAPQFDLEWAFDGQTFWLLQARPLTAVGGWKEPGLQGQPVIWSRGNTGDVLPLPLSAIDWSAAQNIGHRVLESSLLSAGYTLNPAAERFKLHQGHLYMNMTLMQWELNRAFGISPKDTTALLGGQQLAPTFPPVRLRARLHQGARLLKLAVLTPRLRWQGRRQAARLIRWSARQAQRPLPTHPLRQAEQLDRLFMQLNRQHALFFMQGGSGASVWVLRKVLERLLPGEGQVLALDLLRGGRPSVSAAQGHDLARLAALIRLDTAAQAWVQQAAGGPHEPGVPALPRRHPVRRAFAEYLRRYGHRATYESYTRHARWREDPTPLLLQLCFLVKQGPTPSVESAQISSAQSSAQTRLRERLPRTLRFLWPALSLLARQAQQELRDRELGRSAVFSPVEPYRRLLLHISRGWVAVGHLAQSTDIFDLTLPEIHALLRRERPLSGLKELVLDRQQVTGAWLKQSVPDVYTEGRMASPLPEASEPLAGETAGKRTFTGISASGGAVTGRACVMGHPDDLQDFEPGDILVVPATDSSWTPVFLQARGLVMETGGLLSHGTIVAREFGLPIVLNVRGIRQHVRTGDLLHVNAAAGTVTLFDRKDPQ
jgi:phosphohistidine swiveling domain-containing protein